MRKGNWVFAGMIGCLISCLPPGHPPTEKFDTAQDALDSVVKIDAEDSVQTDAGFDSSADAEVAFMDADSGRNDENTALDLEDVEQKPEVQNDKIDVEQESASQDVETGEEKKDSSSDDGATVIPDEDTVDINNVGNDTVDSVGVDTIDSVGVDTPECPEGYYYDPEKGCVAFCGADKYFEKKIGKCLLYPCSGCDLNGQWELAVLDADSMTFTYYTLTIMQSVSYLKAQLVISSLPEVADCSGTLENKDFTLSCGADEFTLILTSETAASDEMSGFYSYSYKDGKFKNGPFNLKKNN
ncbi:hypothetical protein HZB94_00845 [Candidatus Falkowbacteria bacterium]|nr:hypothetical protein [Candidatus Falkowbacteria bacterium]